MRANADEDCGEPTDCDALCAIVPVYESTCGPQFDGYLNCAEAAADLCASDGMMTCAAEQLAIFSCISPPADGGPASDAQVDVDAGTTVDAGAGS